MINEQRYQEIIKTKKKIGHYCKKLTLRQKIY